MVVVQFRYPVIPLLFDTMSGFIAIFIHKTNPVIERW